MEEESLAFVLDFLRSLGCERAQEALLKEINEKYPSLGAEPGQADDEGNHHYATENEDAANKAAVTASISARAKDTQHGQPDGTAGADLVGGSSSVSAVPAVPLGKVVVGRTILTPERDAAALFAPATTWGHEVDEYDNMEDVGYRRKQVHGKERFVEQELDLTSEEGSEVAAVQASKSWALADDDRHSSGSTSDEEEQETPPQRSSPAQPQRCMPAPTPMPAAFASYLAAAQTASNAGPPSADASPPGADARPPAADEAEWDMGPMDIKIADPVITPRKERGPDEEPGRPVLSRVESLSSSFKDFDLDDDDQALGRSSQPSETELLLSDVDAIEFIRPAGAELDVVYPQSLDLFSRSTHSRTSSTEAAPSPFPAAAPMANLFEKHSLMQPEHGHELGEGLNIKPGAAAVAGAGVGELKETAGGFSFPVTPSAEDTDSKLFKSWPSIRSSSMSEMAPNLDDVSASQVADYADDGYRSRLSSRTPSQKNEESRDPPGSSTSTPSPSPQLLSSPDASQSLPHAHSGSGDLGADECPSPVGSPSPSPGPAGDPGRGPAAASQGSPTEPAAGPASGRSSGAASPRVSGASSAPEGGSGRASGDGPSRSRGEEGAGPAEEEAGPSRRGAEEEGGGSMDWQEPAGDEPESLDDGSGADQLLPKYTVDENGAILYQYDPEYINQKYEIFNIQIIHRRHHTGFEETKDFPIRMNDLIAGRYQVLDFLGSAAFSRAVQALDIKTNTLVCLKIVKNSKDYLDQSLDEIKLLKFVNSHDPSDAYGIVRLYDYFYYKEHLFLVCELLRANLYEFQKYNKESSGEELYFTNARIQKISVAVLKSLAFLHSLDLIHSDLKPENILIKSYSRCEVKVIDLGSSCFTTDQLSSYVQSRSYRAPEVILGLPYNHKVDIWSLGCILAELSSGYVLFQNDSVATLLARLEGILGRMPARMIEKGRYSHRFFTRSGQLYEAVKAPSAGASPGAPDRYELLLPKRTSLRHRMPDADPGLVSFVSFLLCLDPAKRPSASEALSHPWLQQAYPSLDS